MIRAFDKLAAFTTRIGKYLAMAAILAMFLLLASEIIGRSCFHTSLKVADEFAAYMMVAVTFCGMAYSLREGAMLKFDMVVNHLSQTIRVMLEILSLILALTYFVLLVYESGGAVYEAWDMEFTSVQASGILLWVPYSILPIGVAIFLIELIAAIFRSCATFRSRGGI
ncbi:MULTISPECIES: TRAP transporter small permease [unclassified Pyramidobacter]|uniref:TRAP transporter small permease n=1 Tax=unclassified Pyramidobacter TaxID=2632171 RepID=UPI000EA16531|nr:TRAP transporter small permease subunit [Pyramidobacter sp. CG50-2]RKJ76091.1 TRAP transporter small permease subunit [Pyramidobacter sp. CG50-2]